VYGRALEVPVPESLQTLERPPRAYYGRRTLRLSNLVDVRGGYYAGGADLARSAQSPNVKIETHGRTTISPGPEGRLNFTPRSWLILRVAGISNWAIWTFLVQEPLLQ